MREIGAIGILDLAEERFVWALRGPWVGQHDPDLLPNGNMLLFDNYGHYGEGGISRVIEFDPPTAGIVLAVRRHARASRSTAGCAPPQERLANGNTLITEEPAAACSRSRPRRDRLGVRQPGARRGRGEDGGDLIPIVSWGQRIDPATLDPDFVAP